MNIVAVLAVRNEAPFIANALRHCARNGVSFAVIDNGSDDGTAEKARSPEFRDRLVRFHSLPFHGEFELARQLEAKMAMIEQLDADWIIHADADEIMHSYNEGETLADAVGRIDTQGFNVIDFNEFVFVPVDQPYQPDIEGPQPILSYYFFEPKAPRLMRAWKKSAGLSMSEHAGHTLSGSEVRLSPEKMALRHYLFRDQQHAFTKYPLRRFPAAEVSRGWHNNRVNLEQARFRFPAREALHYLPSAESRELDRSRPRNRHYWQWPIEAGRVEEARRPAPHRQRERQR